MQLNNSTTGKVIIIDKIYVDRNRVNYSIYEYGGSAIVRNKSYLFTTVILTDFLAVETNFEILCYETLAAEIDVDYVISEDLTNWVIETGSTGDPSTLRVYIPSSILNRVMHTDNALDQLLKAMAPLAPQVVRLENGAHQYLIELEDIHKTILEVYPEIIIEYKE